MNQNLTIRDFARQQVTALLGRLAFEVNNAARSNDPEAVHDLRVSIRRFTQGLRTFSAVLDRSETKRIRARIRPLLDAAAAVRDRDIALELLESAGIPKRSPLAATLRSDRAAAERDLRNLLKQWQSRDQSSRWRSRLGLEAS